MSLREQIAQTIADIEELKAVQRHYQNSLDQKKELEGQKNSLEREVEKELNDVHKIENSNVTRLFHKMLGDVEKKVEREREEYLAKVLELKEVTDALDLIDYELNVIGKKVTKVNLLSDKLKGLKKDRLIEIRTTQSEFRPVLLELEDQYQQNVQINREIDEILRSGNTLLKSLAYCINALDKSNYWLSGSNQQYGAEARANQLISAALTELAKVKVYAYNFNKELADINHRHVNLNLDLGIKLRYNSAFFFRNFISDMIYINKINGGITILQQNSSMVQSILHNVRNEQNRIAQENVGIEERIDTLLEQ